MDYRKYRVPGQVEEPPKGGGGCGRCCKWVFRLLGVGTLVAAVVVGYNLVSPAVEPCPESSPTIPPPGPLLVVLDVYLDECVSVDGDVVSQDVGELVVEVDRGDYVQWVLVLGPEDVFQRAFVGGWVQVAGRIGEDEEAGYVVHYGVDRGWWGNLRENLPGDVFTP